MIEDKFLDLTTTPMQTLELVAGTPAPRAGFLS